MRRLRELADLSGRVAVVTGAAGHLGSAIASALAERGAAVAVVDLEADACARVADALTADHSVPTLPVPADLADPEATRAVPTRVEAEMGGVDVLVNCAALVGTSDLEGWTVPLAQQSLDAWRRALEVNLTAPFVLTQAAAPLLRRSGRGSVVNIGSIYGVLGPDWRLYESSDTGNPAAYAASKGGLTQLTRWLATTLAPDVRVNAVSPGGILRGHGEAFRSAYEARTPLRRMGAEEDVVGAVAFFASDLSAYVTGQNLLVDGGWAAW